MPWLRVRKATDFHALNGIRLACRGLLLPSSSPSTLRFVVILERAPWPPMVQSKNLF